MAGKKTVVGAAGGTRKKTSARGGSGARSGDFTARLESALGAALAAVDRSVGDERWYAFVLYTSGQSDFSYVCASAATEEGLERIAARYAAGNADYAGEAGRRALRWSIADWELHDCSEEVGALALPGGRGAARDAKIYAAFVDALTRVGKTEPLARRRPAPILAVTCGDMDQEFFLRSLTALNPRAVVEEYRRAHTPEPFLAELAGLPPERRRITTLALYRDLVLGADNPFAGEARRRNVSQYALEPAVVALGSSVVEPLLDWVDEFGSLPPFNPKGSEAWKRHGAFSPAHDLACSAVRLVGEIGLSSAEVERLLAILARRVDRDRVAEPPVSCLAASIARTLHRRFPDRFPKEKGNSRTNRLDNAEKFLSARG
jgi:hypothetical protein